MTTSPLARRRVETPSGDPVQDLHDHVEKCNSYNWVVASGKLYFVNRRTKPNGQIEHFVDRHI